MARPASRPGNDAAPAKKLRDAGARGASSSGRQRRRRRLSRHARSRSRAVPQALRLRLDPRAARPHHHRTLWRRQKLACLRSRPEGLPGGYLRPLQRVPRLFGALALARGDGRYGKLLKSLSRIKLLILDDWGPETLTAQQARDLLEIVEDRFDNASTLVTSQVPVDRWHDMIGNPTLADAILDRLVHNAYRVELSGESLRKNRVPEHAS